MQENLDLRKKITSAEEKQQTAKKENEKLSRDAADLEKKITESVLVINRLKVEQGTQAQNRQKNHHSHRGKTPDGCYSDRVPGELISGARWISRFHFLQTMGLCA